MFRISAEDFLLWEKKQLSKGGDKLSLSLLIEFLGGISNDELNQIRCNFKRDLNLKQNLELLESNWEDHLYKSKPIQQICGFTYWRDLKLKVSKKVLIPRPETEIIIDIIKDRFKDNSKKFIFAELGTGSGAISIALALENPCWEGIATDIDKDVLDIALRNFIYSSKQSNLSFIYGNWLNPLDNFKKKLDLVISNPPYIPRDTYEQLPKEVKRFEPKIALLGGEDGLVHIREIIKNTPFYLKEKGWLIIENHFDQGDRVKQLFLDNKFTSVEVLKDFSGIGRFTIGRYK